MEKIRTHFLNTQKLPLVIEPNGKGMDLESLLHLLKEKNQDFKDYLIQYGGLLFRNFPISDVEDFKKVVIALGTGEFVDYIGGGTPRTKINSGVYTSTEAPPPIKILLHNELSFAANFPNHVYFYCHVPPDKGGETFIGDARKVYDAINDKVKQKFVDNGIKYISRYYYKSNLMNFINKIQKGHRSWIDVFETDKKEEVEEKCSLNQIQYKWNQNDWLEITRIRPAVHTHPKTNERVWFNQVHTTEYTPKFLGWWRYIGMRLFYLRKHMLVDEARYADGSKIPHKDINHIIDVLNDHSIYFPWQKGDVMVLDNILTMHGRAPYKGKRKIMAAMTK